MLLYSVVLALVVSTCLGQIDPLLLAQPRKTKVLNPPYFNIATGKKIGATATCGNEGAERFCKLTGGTNYEYHETLHQGQVCDVCEASSPRKAHPVRYAIDGTERWWQSPPLSRGNQYNKVNITIDLGQVFHVAYVLIKFANSPRAGTWVLERSSDHGETFKPWQYFANTVSDCFNFFGEDSQMEVTRDDSVICTADYSAVVPLENGEVIVPLVKGRPGANNFSYAAVLQEWSKATNVRIRLLRTKTLLGHLMAVSEEDPTVTRRYYYSIKDISIGGRCVCNGHADRCSSDPDDQYKLKCECQHNTCGDSCEMCCVGFVQKAWKAAVPESTNECEECNCHDHSTECVYDEDVAMRRLSLDKYGNYEGGGRCLNCQHNTTGINCEQCAPGFWRPNSIDARDPYGCRPYSFLPLLLDKAGSRRVQQALQLIENDPSERLNVLESLFYWLKSIQTSEKSPSSAAPTRSTSTAAVVVHAAAAGLATCDCDSAYTLGSCEPTTGRCYCKPQFSGDRCDRCAPGYYDFPTCKQCDCYYNGTLHERCLPRDDACPCQYNFAGKYCNQCAPTFYDFPNCSPCACEGEGVASNTCDAETGSCQCENGFTGPKCEQCAPGFYNYPFCRRCACSDVGTTDQVCDVASGQCFCMDRYTGSNCDNCKEGYFGFPNCQECACTNPGRVDNNCDRRSGKCVCKANYEGDDCSECAPDHYGYPNCLPCKCKPEGSIGGSCDALTGQCLCRENVAGRACEKCMAEFFNFPQCEECSCYEQGIKNIVPGVCLAFTKSQCDCKDHVQGVNCDECEPLYYDITKGCVDCNCFVQGTLDGVGECDREDGQCFCKPYTCTQRCSQCSEGFFGLEERNYFGCRSCRCDVGGSLSADCDMTTGKCQCRRNIIGRRCNRPKKRHYFASLHEIKREFEDGHSPELTGVRFSFDETVFPNFSMRGYTEFSSIQSAIILTVNVHQSGLYRLLFRYQNNRGRNLKAKGTLIADTLSEDGVEQPYNIEFPVNVGVNRTTASTMFTVPVPFVLNRGTWKVILRADDGLLVDYFVLLPSDYYEPKVLQQAVSQPCKPESATAQGECIMFTHPNLLSYHHVYFNDHVVADRVESPSTAHPGMVVVNGNTGYSTLEFNMRVAKAGKYVIVVEYASKNDELQSAEMVVTSGSKEVRSNLKIFACAYSFICRQVVLDVLDSVQVFEFSLSEARVQITAHAGDSFYVTRAYAIPFADWSMELVEPKARCITKRGESFDRCMDSEYPVPPKAIMFEITSQADALLLNGHARRPSTILSDETDLVYLDGVSEQSPPGVETQIRTTLQITKNLTPGRYIFMVHYYNPDHLSFFPEVVVDGGISTTGSANITYCPHADGCRAVVTTDDGSVVVEVRSETTTFTITVPHDKAFWIEYVLAVPERQYNPSLFEVEATDKSGDFIRLCNINEEQNNGRSVPEFCEKSSFSLSVKYNDGAKPCECSGAGTIGGADTQCEVNGGQCPCKENVIGRRCEECKMGYFGFPDCQPCDCGGLTCDVNGECVCPPNTIEPDCMTCQPLFHSFDVIQGCMDCACNMEGVHNASTDTACDAANGQCNCREHVTGHKCDQCAPGFYGFPNCQRCTCDDRGSVSDGCDPQTGQCSCKKNVEGLRCDRCKEGSFYLHALNQDGCLECFCFGKSDKCHYSQYPATEIADMSGWHMIGLNTNDPSIFLSSDSTQLTTNIDENGGVNNRDGLYWNAPDSYLNNNIASYGGVLTFARQWSYGRGDSDEPAIDYASGTTAKRPDILLRDHDYEVGYYHPNQDQGEVKVKLSERNFKHISSGQPVTRPEMMRLLNGLSSLRILATPYSGSSLDDVSLSNVSMETTDYDLQIGSGEPIAGVEECDCPEGYTGHSCQLCGRGHYQDLSVGGDGICRRCDCYPNCDFCDWNGNLISGEDCLHNTGGENCKDCKDGFYGNSTDGVVTDCQPCPCPFATQDGNFADSCSEEDGELVCMCQKGYAGIHCEQCAEEYFGNPAVLGGTCQPCNCNGNLDPNLILETCDTLTGECSGCLYNTGGKYCERCADGFFGDAIDARDCRKCGCDECGTEVCDHQTGSCTCKGNVMGANCDQCAPGTYGFQSCSGCKNCACAPGSISELCDIETGQCQCAPNVVGLQCDRCAPGFYGYDLNGCKACQCRNNGPCNPVNGECQCPPGITGNQCDECVWERHVLKPGKTECERCGKCTDDLLDEVEPMTDRVKVILNGIFNVSVGVFARQRLNSFQDAANIAERFMNENEDKLDEAFQVVNSVANTSRIDQWNEDVSGSGEEPETLASGYFATGMINGEGMLDEMDANDDDDESKLNFFISRMIELDNPVSKMCKKMENLTERVEETAKMVKSFEDFTNELAGTADEFIDAVAKLLDSLNPGMPEDSEELEDNLKRAEGLLREMKAIDMSPMQDAADEELELAKQLLMDIEGKFTEPTANMSDAVGQVLDDLDTRHEKLKDLRNKLNDAQQKTNMARDTNSVNNKNLTTLTDVVNAVNRDLNEGNEALAGATQQMNNTAGSMARTEGMIDELEVLKDSIEENIENMTPVHDKLEDNLEMLNDSLAEAIEHAKSLKADVDALAAIEMAESAPTKVANRYRNITNAMGRAKVAADDALAAAKNASENAASKNLEEEARKAQRKSIDLLSSTNDMKNNPLSKLQKDIEETEDAVDDLADTRQSLKDRLDQLEADIAAFDRSDLGEKIDTITNTDAQTQEIATKTSEEADALDAKLSEKVDTTSDLPADLSAIEEKIDEVAPKLLEEKKEYVRAVVKKNAVVQLRHNLSMNNLVEKLRKKIQITRNMANMVKTSMRFKAVEPHTTELRVPKVILDTAHSITVEITVKVSADAPNNHLLLVRDGRANGDYITIETENGQVKYIFKVGAGTGKITSDRTINNDNWHVITASRKGKGGELTVREIPPEASVRGDSEPSAGDWIESKKGSTSSDNLVAMMRWESLEIYVGRRPGEAIPTGNAANGNFCVEDVKVNDERVGLYNFKSHSGVSPAQNCDESKTVSQIVFQSWRFPGVDSYLRYNRSDSTFNVAGSRQRAHFIGFKMLTSQHDGLLFVVGQTTEQFMALEVKGGKLHLTWNFGFPDGVKNRTVAEYDDVTREGRLLIKAGYVPSRKLVALSVNIQVLIRETWTGHTAPDFQSDIWVGGSWCKDVPDALEKHVVNLRKHFRGCITDLQFNGRTRILSNAIENVGVSVGCTKETVQDLNFKGQEYIGVTSGLHRASNVSGGLSFCAGEANAGMVSFVDTTILGPKNAGGADDYDYDLGLAANLTGEEETTMAVVVPSVRVVATTTVAPPPPTTTTAPPPPPPTEPEEETIDYDVEVELERARLRGPVPGGDGPKKDEGVKNLTLIVGVIVAVVLVSLLAAVISAFRNGPTPTPGPMPYGDPEQSPLNDMQEQTPAQIEW